MPHRRSGRDPGKSRDEAGVVPTTRYERAVAPIRIPGLRTDPPVTRSASPPLRTRLLAGSALSPGLMPPA